mmetsp:Transcript_6948/g.42450  ORF Transcript_6948/g.42450 Transcript_6948/m.42450 type:complete len:589 (-) Transcript_6948:1957-3723(-)
MHAFAIQHFGAGSGAEQKRTSPSYKSIRPRLRASPLVLEAETSATLNRRSGRASDRHARQAGFDAMNLPHASVEMDEGDHLLGNASGASDTPLGIAITQAKTVRIGRSNGEDGDSVDETRPLAFHLDVEGEDEDASLAKEWFGFPVGLYVLAGTELWERFSYYGMKALLVLYMNDGLFEEDRWQGVYGLPTLVAIYGGLDDTSPLHVRQNRVQQVSSSIYGLYTSLVYLTPIVGGLLADRKFGQYRVVVVGGFVIIVGHVLMSFHSTFLLALLFIVIGTGGFKSNISTQVGRLFHTEDSRRDTAFSIFYCGINLGAFIAPLVTGVLHHGLGFGAGFSAAAVGMAMGMVLYIGGQKYVPGDKTEKSTHFSDTWGILAQNKRRVLSIMTMSSLTVVFWAVYEQKSNTLALFEDREVNRYVGGLHVPTEWFQSIDALFILAFTPLIGTYWRYQNWRNQEPCPETKMGIGYFFASASYLVLLLPVLLFSDVGMVWIILMIAVLTVGELYLSPIGLSFVSQNAPPQLGSFLMGVWFLASFAGNYLAGFLGTFYTRMGHAWFFALLSLLAILNGAMVLLLRPWIQRGLQSTSIR